MGSYKKKLFIVLLLILLISFFVCSSSFAVSSDPYNYTLDTQYSLESYQERMAYIFLTRLSQYGSYDGFINDVKDKYVLFSMGTGGSSGNGQRMFCTIYPSIPIVNNLTEVNSSTTEFFDYYLNLPSTGYNLNSSNFNGSPTLKRYTLNVDNNTIFDSDISSTTNIFMPTLLIGYQNKMVTNFINGVEPNESALNFIISAINENTEEQQEQTEEMKKLNDFMSSEDVDDDAYDMTTNNPTQDITESGINGIFNMFYDKIDNWESENITIRIPFANKIFIIPSDLTENIVNSYFPSNTQFGRLFSLIWYYLLGVYIVKDIQKYIDGLQTGEILTKSDTNIKTEML